ncbi:MAG TPA: hypothetical protein P5293_06115, partial [Bacteroidales bacterium]|nr:hypothetical protein [Bacteroidales bacterium]
GIRINQFGASYGTPPIVNSYGLYISDGSETTVSGVNYNFYSAGATALNYFEGILTVAGGTNFNKTSDDDVGYITTYTKSRGAAGQDGDDIGTISFKSYNDAGTPELIEYARILSDIADSSDASERGRVTFTVRCMGDTTRDPLVICQPAISGATGLVTINAVGFINNNAMYINAAGAANGIWADASQCFCAKPSQSGCIGFIADDRTASGGTALQIIAVNSSGNVYPMIEYRGYTNLSGNFIHFDVAYENYDVNFTGNFILWEKYTTEYFKIDQYVDFSIWRRTADAVGHTTTFIKTRAAAGQDGDDIATFSFKSYNDAGTPELIEYARIVAEINDASDGTEDGQLTFYSMDAGTLIDTFRIFSGRSLMYRDDIALGGGSGYTQLGIDL